MAKSCGGHIQSIPHVIQAVANLSSCGGHIQSIPHVIQAVANLSSYSLGSQSASILYGDSSPQLLLDSEIKWGTVLGIWQGVGPQLVHVLGKHSLVFFLAGQGAR